MTALLLVLAVTIAFAGCADKSNSLSSNKKAVDYGTPEASFEGQRMVHENDNLALYIDGKTTEIIVEDKKSGEKWYSNPLEREGDAIAAGVGKEVLSSQLSITYHDDSAQKFINNYTESIAKSQYEIYLIENGVKVVYTLGKKSTIIILPQALSEERFLHFLEKLEDPEDQAAIKRRYELLSLDKVKSQEQHDKLLGEFPKLTDHNIYRLNKGTSQYIQLESEEILRKAGYTAEDMAEDHQENGIQVVKPDDMLFTIPIEYKLEGGSFLATIPINEIEYSSNFTLLRVSMLEFFGAAGDTDEGYMFVPDGSGALIHLNNSKSDYGLYSGTVYGRDRAKQLSELAVNQPHVSFPVFGMKKSTGAYVAVIEDADEFAYINAGVSGKDNSYNGVYAGFEYLASDVLNLGNSTGASVNVYQPRSYEGNFSVRYTFLDSDESDYMGMATYYQKYLVEKGLLQESEQREKLPFYLELIGAIDKTKTVFGVPVEVTEALTSYSEALDIVEQLNGENVNEIVLKYSGMANGGVRHTPLSSVKPIGKLGGASDLRTLTKAFSDKNMSLYADIGFQYIQNTSLFDGFNKKNDALRFIYGDVALLFPYDIVSASGETKKHSTMMLTPQKYMQYAKNLTKDLKKYGIFGYSDTSFGKELNSAYTKKEFSDLSQTADAAVEAFGHIRGEGMDIMLGGANAYMLAGVRDILNLPADNSFQFLLDESIPFCQMVLRGYVEYAGEPVNLANDPVRAFLKTVETGSGLYYKWIYRDNSLVRRTEYEYLYSVNYSVWKDQATAQYKELEEIFSDLQGQKIMGHQRVENDVYKVTYEQGTQIIVNYSESDVLVDGIVVKAMDYAVKR